MEYYNNSQQQTGAYLPSINYYINDEYANQTAAAFAANQLDPYGQMQQHHFQHQQMALMEQPPGVAVSVVNNGNGKRRLSDVTNEDFDDIVGGGEQQQLNGKKSKPLNPFAPECSIPLPFQLSDEFGYFGPASIWKRNERERHRVRCVNDGYEKLRSHLPFFDKEKRLSKVETLRLAIRYIRHMQKLLINENHNDSCECNLDVQATCGAGDEPCDEETGKRRRGGKKQKFSTDDSDSFEDADF